MSPEALKADNVVRGPLFPGPVQVLIVTPIGASVRLIGKGLNSVRLGRDAGRSDGQAKPPTIMKKAEFSRIRPIELEMVGCVGRGDYSNLKRLLLEGVSPNILGGHLLLLAAQHGQTLLTKLLLRHGAKVPRRTEVALLGAAVASAVPRVLELLIRHLGEAATERALRRHGYAVIAIAGDVCRKAQRYEAKQVKLSSAEVARRRDELLGDAVRVAVWTFDELPEAVWRNISERSRDCARILRDAFEPTLEADMRAVEQFLEPYVD